MGKEGSNLYQENQEPQSSGKRKKTEDRPGPVNSINDDKEPPAQPPPPTPPPPPAPPAPPVPPAPPIPPAPSKSKE